MAKHAYWRIRGLRGTGNAQFSKIEFRETIGGANVATGGTAFASTEFSSSYVAAYAFNENNSDYWAASGSVGQWIAYHFPTPIKPAEIAMRVGDNAASYWRFAAVDWSDDGVTWTNSGLFIPDQSPVASWLVYDLLERGTGDAIEGQAYRYWRLRTLDWVSGGYQQIGEFRLLNGATNLITSAGGSASADVAFSGFPASAAFDANFTTAWVDDGTSTVSHWLQWDFGANNAQIVTGYELAPRTSAPEQFPPAWALECSNDGTNWTVADYRTEQTGWTTGVYRAFDIEYNTARPVVRSRSSSVTVFDAVTSITLTRGATLVDDLLVAAVVGRSEITAPAGWTLLRSVSFSSDTTTQYLNIYTKRATASEPTTYEFTQASAGRFNGYIISLYNPLNGLVHVDAHSGGVYNTSSAALSAPSITVAKDDSLLLLVPSSILSQPSPATANWSYSERITSLGLPAASDKRVDGAIRYVEAGTHASRYVATINFTPGAATAYGMAVIAFTTGVSTDFTFDYELIPALSDINADFTFNYAVQVGTGFSFDYAYTTTVDFSFDYAVSLGASFEFDNVIDLGAPFAFDYAVQLGAAFDFDSATQVGASFTFTNRIEGLVSVAFAFDYAVDLGSSFTFDYAYSVDAEFSFDYKYEIAAVFASDYAIQLGASFGFDFRYVITANFAFDYGYELGVPFDFDYAVQIGVDFDFDFGFGFVRDFTFSYKLATVEIFADFSFSYLTNAYAFTTGFMLVPETPVAERWEYLTTSAVARDGSEQRAALRRNPRVSVDYNFVVTTEAERRVMFDLLYQKIRGAFLVPLYAYAVQISAPVAQGQKVVSYNAARTDIRAGDFLYYMTPDGETGAFETAAIVGTNSLTLAFGAGFALPAGSWIMPALEMTAAVGAGLSMRALGGSVAVAFDALDNRRPLPRPGSTATVQTFDGFPVVTQRHSADASITDQFDGGLISLDEAVDVRRALFSPQSSVFVGGARSYRVKRNSEALDYWRDLLDMTKGKRSPFLISTYRNDLEPGANVAGNELNVIGREYLDKFESNAFKRLEIEAAGVVSWHKVTGVSTIAGGLRLTLDTPYANADIDRVSFLNLVRLNSDTINVTHEQLDTVINLSVRSVDA